MSSTVHSGSPSSKTTFTGCPSRYRLFIANPSCFSFFMIFFFFIFFSLVRWLLLLYDKAVGLYCQAKNRILFLFVLRLEVILHWAYSGSKQQIKGVAMKKEAIKYKSIRLDERVYDKLIYLKKSEKHGSLSEVVADRFNVNIKDEVK